MIDVLQSFARWLPLTQTWNFTQLRFLPADVRWHVVAETVDNLEQFPAERLHAVALLPLHRRLVEKLRRRTTGRDHRDFLRATAMRIRPAVHHSHFGNIGWCDLAAVRAAAARHVVTFYGADVSWLPRRDAVWRQRYQELFAAADLVLCEGPHMAGEIRALGCPAGKVRVHHIGVAVGEIPFRPRRLDPGSPLRALIAATFVEKKGIPDAIAALGMLATETPVELTILGDEADDPRCRGQRARVLEALERAGLCGSTRLLGFQPHARFFEEAARHHVFLAPSVTAEDGDTEGGAPVSIIEALATGMLVVATTHCDIPEVIRDGECGLLAAERDVPALATRLRALVAHSEGWERMGRAGRRRVEAEFDARVQAARLAEIYRELAAGR